MTDSTDVDTDALLAFGAGLRAYLQGSTSSQGYQAATLTGQVSTGGPVMGLSGMREAAYADSSHTVAAVAAGQFLLDTYDGLLAFAYAAAQVAETYHAGDAESADQLAAVTAAFTPQPGQPSIASQHADAAAAQQAAAAAAPDAGRADDEEARFRNQVDAAAGVQSTPQIAGASTVDHGRRDPQEPGSDRYTTYIDQVGTQQAFVAGGGRGGSADDDYDPRGEYQEALERAERLSARDHIPYEFVVDDHGTSEVEQTDPDDVPRPDPVDYTTRSSSPDTTYSPYPSTGG